MKPDRATQGSDVLEKSPDEARGAAPEDAPITDISAQIEAQHEAAKKVLRSSDTQSAWRLLIRRLFAFALDCATLVALGKVIGYAFKAQLVALGENGIWLGMGIATVYFTIFDSSITGGTTLGKRLFNIELKRSDGSHLSPLDAFLRFVPCIIVFSIMEFCMLANQSSPIILALEFIGAVTALSMIVFSLTDYKHRTSADILLNSEVAISGKEYKPSNTRSHHPIAIIIGLGAIVIAVQGVRAWQTMQTADGKAEAALTELMHHAAGDVQQIRVNIKKADDAQMSGYMTLFVKALLPSAEDKAQAANIASHMKVLAESSNLLPSNIIYMVVSLESGYNIGLAEDLEEIKFKFPVGVVKTKKAKPAVRVKATKGKSQR